MTQSTHTGKMPSTSRWPEHRVMLVIGWVLAVLTTFNVTQGYLMGQTAISDANFIGLIAASNILLSSRIARLRAEIALRRA